MKNCSFLTFEESYNHDQHLLKNGRSMNELIKIAGALITSWIDAHYPNQSIIGIIGKGNNGQDILSAFIQSTPTSNWYLYPVFEETKKTPLYKKCLEKEGCTEINELNKLPQDGIILDGIFGTGLNQKNSSNMHDLINKINGLNLPIIAIDIPSGLTETPQTTPCIMATNTLSMMFPKQVFLNQNKQLFCGEIFILNFQLDSNELNGYNFKRTTDNYIKLPL